MRKKIFLAVFFLLLSGSLCTASDFDDNRPSEHICPITMSIMIDPVVAADGHTYERSAIEQWLVAHQTSPKTNLQLPHRMLTPNHSLKNLINDWEENDESTSTSTIDLTSDEGSILDDNDIDSILDNWCSSQFESSFDSSKKCRLSCQSIFFNLF